MSPSVRYDGACEAKHLGGPPAAGRNALTQKIGRVATEGLSDAPQRVDTEAAAALDDSLHLPVVELGGIGELAASEARLVEPCADGRPDAAPHVVASSHAARIIGPVGDGLQVRASKP